MRRGSIVEGLQRGESFLSRHCEPTGRANARPMTGSAKQSIATKRQNGLLRRFTPRNDEEARLERQPLLHHLRDRLAAGGRVGIAAEIAGAQGTFAERAFDGANNGVRRMLLAE